MVQSFDQGISPPNDIQQLARDFHSSTDILRQKMSQSKASLGLESSIMKGTYGQPASYVSSVRDPSSIAQTLKANRFARDIPASHHIKL